MNVFTPLGAVQHWAETDPNKLLLTFVSIEEDDTFAEENRTAKELLDNGLKLASALSKEGMKEGDRFALVMKNHPEFIEGMLASEILGTIFVPIDLRAQPERIAFMMEHTDCRGAIVSEEGLDKLRSLDKYPDLLEWTWVIDSESSYDELSSPVTSLKNIIKDIDQEKALLQPANPKPLNETMQMLFTSGTTGNPKAIQSNYYRFASVGAVHKTLGITLEDRPYTGLSLAHANAQLISLGLSFSLGLSLVISRTFTKSRLWDIVSHYNCTTFNLLGGIGTSLFAQPESPRDHQHNVRFVLSAGMPVSMWKEFEQRFNVKIFEFYGTAEGGLTFNPPGVGPIGSVGKPLEGTQCEILNEHDEPQAPFDIGEISFRNADGKVDPVTYFKNPEESEKKNKGGWFRSGDYGYKDEEGWLYFSYREGGDANIRRSGEFIIVEDMMKALARHPEVSDVYVYGISLDENSPGEQTVVAAITIPEGQKLVIDDFLTHVKNTIGQGPYPDYFQILDEIPKTPSEKPIDRFLVQNLNTGNGIIFSGRGEQIDHINSN